MSPVFHIVTLLFVAGAFSVDAAKTKWSYVDTNWDGVCQTGRQQSPINLDSSKAVTRNYEKLAFINYDQTLPMKLINNGHTVQFNIDHPQATVLASGGLPGVYYLAQLHFHWGSEHTVQNQRLPLEVHFVHYDRRYDGLSEAMHHADGIAVVGILFKEAIENNTKLDPLITTLEKVNGVVDTEFPQQLVPQALFPDDIDKFYRYRGSLTTPSCDETVVWTVLGNYVPISKSQYKRFQSIRIATGPMGTNFRPVQPLNSRTVSLTLMAGTGAGGGVTINPTSSLLTGAILAVYAHYYL